MSSEIRFRAEDVWSFYWRWVISRGGSNDTSIEEVEIMKVLMQDAKVNLERFEKPLNQTIQPVSASCCIAFNSQRLI